MKSSLMKNALFVQFQMGVAMKSEFELDASRLDREKLLRARKIAKI